MRDVAAELVDGRIRVECGPHERDLMVNLATIPSARWVEDDNAWTLPLNWGVCAALRGTFRDRLRIGPALNTWAKRERQTRIDPCIVLREAADDPTGNPDLWASQRVSSRFMRTARRAWLGDDMGAGKTRAIADAIHEVTEAEPELALPVLLVSPMSVKRDWRAELARTAPGLTVEVVPASPASAVARRKAILAGADVVVLHWDQVALHSRLAPVPGQAMVRCAACSTKAQAARWRRKNGDKPMATAAQCEAHERELNQVRWGTIIADEAHRLCNPKNRWTRALWHLQDGVEFVWAMTGSGQEDAVDDLWGILHFYAPEEWPSYASYVDRYCATGYAPWGGVNVVGLRPEREAEWRSVFEPRFLRRTFEELHPDVPEPLFQERRVELPAKLRKAYEEIKRQGVATLGDSQLVAWDPLTELTRLTQLACAELEDLGPDGTGRPQWRLHGTSPKVEELIVVMRELGRRQVVVAAESRQLIEMAEAALTKAKITHASIRGGVSEDARETAKEDFAAGRAQVLLLTMGTGGDGLNLDAADTLVFLQRSWSFKKNRQTMRRIIRPQSKRHARLLIIDIVAADTVEEANLSRYDRKLERHERTFQDKAKLRRLLETNEVDLDSDTE